MYVRHELITKLSVNGGHLGPNLGVVELTNVGNRIQSATFQPVETLVTVGVTYLVLTMLVLSVRLIFRGMKELPEAASMAMTHAGIIVMVAVSLVTVYLGEQVIPALFMIFAWADVCLLRPYRPEDYLRGQGETVVAVQEQTAFPGKRIIQ